MNIVLGATGQIGSMLVDNLLKKGQPIRAIIRNTLDPFIKLCYNVLLKDVVNII